MKKALMYASVASMIQQFNMNNIKFLQDLGYKVDVACNFEFGSTISNEKIEKLKKDLKDIDVDFYQIPVPRKIFDFKNLKLSYKLTKQLMNEKGYDLVHCHSPIGGIICRIANKNSSYYSQSKMIYTAHGFHFFKGNNPIKNIIFKAIEKYGAQFTDTLITINKEDYNAAKKFKLKKGGTVEYVPGIGIDLDKINSIQGNKEKLCQELNIPSDSILLLSVGELSVRKNQKLVINCLADFDENVHYIICGQGALKEHFLELAKEKKVDHRLHLLGYCSNIIEIMKSCDIFIFPSLQEGLPVALMEALASGLPCIASDIRGNNDLIENDVNGYLFELKESKFNKRMKCVLERKSFEKKLMDQYSVKNISGKMKKIYKFERENNGS